MEKEGFTPYQILRFCNDHKIRCFGFDWKMRQFITNKNSDIKLNTKLPAFVFYFNDKHIYIVSDPKIKKSLLNSNSKSELMSLSSLEAKKKVRMTENIRLIFRLNNGGKVRNLIFTLQKIEK